jgi:hypothetical protein
MEKSVFHICLVLFILLLWLCWILTHFPSSRSYLLFSHKVFALVWFCLLGSFPVSRCPVFSPIEVARFGSSKVSPGRSAALAPFSLLRSELPPLGLSCLVLRQCCPVIKSVPRCAPLSSLRPSPANGLLGPHFSASVDNSGCSFMCFKIRLGVL